MHENFQSRGEQMLDAMKLLQYDIQHYAAGVALLAVHSAIAFNDAVQVKLAGKWLKDADHKRTASYTRKLCSDQGHTTAGIAHLEKLLARKNDYSYSNTIIDDETAYAAGIHAERFQAWALRVIGGLK